MIKKKVLEKSELQGYVVWLDSNPKIPCGMTTVEAFRLQQRKSCQTCLEEFQQ